VRVLVTFTRHAGITVAQVLTAQHVYL